MLKHNQLFLDFINSPNNHLLVFETNSLAYKFLFSKDWLFNVAILYGEKGVGKTTMLKELSKQNGVFINNNTASFATLQQLVTQHSILILEDIDILPLDEENIFALYNLALEHNKKLVFSSSKHLSEIKINLLDLKTRMQSAVALTITYPSKENVFTIVRKILSDNQIKLAESVLTHITKNNNYNLTDIIKTIFLILQYIKENKKIPGKKIIDSLVTISE